MTAQDVTTVHLKATITKGMNHVAVQGATDALIVTADIEVVSNSFSERHSPVEK